MCSIWASLVTGFQDPEIEEKIIGNSVLYQKGCLFFKLNSLSVFIFNLFWFGPIYNIAVLKWDIQEKKILWEKKKLLEISNSFIYNSIMYQKGYLSF